MKTITIKFKNGVTTLSTDGYSGGECKTVTEDLKKKLGTVEETVDTGECFERPAELDLKQNA